MTLRERLRIWAPTRERLENNRWIRWLAPWLGHPKLWHWSRRGVALGVALGVFFGLLIPLAQIPLTAAAAIVLRANLPAAAASTLISNPVTFGPLYYTAFQLGSWLTGQSAPPSASPDYASIPESAKTMWQRIVALGKPLLMGLAIMAVAAGLLTYAVIDLVWRWHTNRKWRRRRQGDDEEM